MIGTRVYCNGGYGTIATEPRKDYYGNDLVYVEWDDGTRAWEYLTLITTVPH